ncbi:MAG: hypothetical protein FWC61_00270 [Proteobacteria bacterium]|nr:hypothetical protein [Pseudomonadota bacterium]
MVYTLPESALAASNASIRAPSRESAPSICATVAYLDKSTFCDVPPPLDP